MKKTVHIITGATGFLGRHLVRRLLESGERICIIVRCNENDAQTRVDHIFSGYVYKYRDHLDVISGDITKKDLGISEKKLREFKNVTVNVWHLAANLSFRCEHKKQIYQDNVHGMINVVDFVNHLGPDTCLFYTSTAYVCGSKNRNCLEDEIDRGQKPRNLYEKTKISAEKIIRNSCQRKFVIFRPSIVVGDAYEGKAVGCTFGYYRFTYVFHVFKKWSIGTLRIGCGFWYKILKLLGTTYDEKSDLLHFAHLILPYPKNSFVNLVPIDYVIDAMLQISASNIKNRTFHLVNTQPPSFILLLREVLDDIGLCGIRFKPFSPAIFNIFMHVCYFVFVPLRKYFESAIKYQPYITTQYDFSVKNIQKAGIKSLSLSREHIKRINQYAIHEVFPHIKI